MNKWHFSKKALLKLSHSIKVLIRRANIAENYPIEAATSWVYTVGFGNRQIQFHQRKYIWSDNIFFQIQSDCVGNRNRSLLDENGYSKYYKMCHWLIPAFGSQTTTDLVLFFSSSDYKVCTFPVE